MTICTGQPAAKHLEAYIQGTLPERQAREFETHFADCEICLGQVEALQAVTLRLGAQPRRPLRPPIPWPIRVGALAAIAAAMILCYIGLQTRRELPHTAVVSGAPPTASHDGAVSPAKTLATSTMAAGQLADLTMPVFRESNLRGQTGDDSFKKGMKAYSAHDCTSARKSLTQVAPGDEDALAARFFLGVCQMHDGDFSDARGSLRNVANAGDSPQQEAALYYLAQIALASNEVDMAGGYLRRTIQLRGDFESRATAELAKIRDMSGRR
jgi:TolA-binding protein